MNSNNLKGIPAMFVLKIMTFQLIIRRHYIQEICDICVSPNMNNKLIPYTNLMINIEVTNHF